MQAAAAVQSFCTNVALHSTPFDRIAVVVKFNSRSEKEAYEYALHDFTVELWDESVYGGFFATFVAAVCNRTSHQREESRAQRVARARTMIACDDTVCVDPVRFASTAYGVVRIGLSNDEPHVVHFKLHPGVRASHVGRAAGVRLPRLRVLQRVSSSPMSSTLDRSCLAGA